MDNKQSTAAPHSIALPKWAVCTITHEVMKLPYVTTGGISFEGDAIRRALERRPNCPTTNKPCQPHQLRFNRNLFDAINAWRTLCGERVVEYASDVVEPELDLEDTDTFIDFVRMGDTEMVRRYVAAGVDVLVTSGDRKSTPLHIAADAGLNEIVEILLEKMIEFKATNVKSSTGATALHMAAQKGHFEIAKKLIPHIDVNVASAYGRTALHQACQAGCLPLVRLLVESGATITSTDSVTCLLLATINNYIEIMRYLLSDCGVDVNEATTDDGDTALHMACQKSDRTAVELLLDHDADVHAKRKNGIMPIHLAAASGNTYAVEQSLAKGVDVDVVGNVTPLFMACQEGHIDIVELLIKNNANVNYQDQDPKKMCSPLHMAALNEHVDCVRALLVAGANVNALSKKKYTAVYLAAVKDNVECVRVLINAGADANIANADAYLPHQLTRSREIMTLCGRDPETIMRERRNDDLIELMSQMCRMLQTQRFQLHSDDTPDCTTQ